MPAISLTNEQAVELIRQLPGEQQIPVLFALARQAALDREQRMQLAEQRLRELCLARGRAWETLSENEREALIDDLVHEDRACGR